jgi:type IV pilus assembly protein PilX
MQKPFIMRNVYKFQQGAVLFVGLIMLVILTLMAVVAMKSSILQERLASGAMDQNVAFQSAESALRDAEIYINANITPASGFVAACTNGLCLPSITSMSVWDAISDWTSDARPIVFGSKTSAPAIPDIARQPRYIIELLPDLPAAPGNGGKSSGNDGTAFRITAMGWGKRPSTAIMLQSVYVKI